jgi:hypothetical protein
MLLNLIDAIGMFPDRRGAPGVVGIAAIGDGVRRTRVGARPETSDASCQLPNDLSGTSGTRR